MKRLIMLVTLFTAAWAGGTDLRIGIGRVDITPDPAKEPVYMAGYAARTQPATGVLHRVWAKSMAIEDKSGKKSVIITMDLCGIKRCARFLVCERVAAKHNLPADVLFFGVSHTHSSLAYWPNSRYSALTKEEARILARQNYEIIGKIVESVDLALADLAPAKLEIGYGEATFAINRRKLDTAPIDHSVPVLKVTSPDGKLRAVLMTYACHNTTLTSKNLLINGDYAGFAMLELEKAYPGATALFLQGCAGDQGPEPRHTVELAMKYGKELADGVEKVIKSNMTTVSGDLRTAMIESKIKLQEESLEHYYQESMQESKYTHAHGATLLNAYSAGAVANALPFITQVLEIGKNMTLLSFTGEMVIDYTLWAKERYPDKNLIVSAYNLQNGYIPSERILEEGGYEGGGIFIYTAFSGSFVPGVEKTIKDSVSQAMCAASGL